MNYETKYLKYKNKYKNLKNLYGGVFNIIKYLGSGAENMAFEIDDKRIIRVRKNCEKLGKEIIILKKIQKQSPLYFVKIHEIGKCNDLIDKFNNTENITNFCNSTGVTLTKLCEYDYVIMENANGINIIDYIIKYLKENFGDKLEKEDLNLDDDINKISLNTLIIKLLQIFKKICDGLIDAQNKIPNFYHGDLNYRNIFINETNLDPIIFDFGNSNDNFKVNSTDILNYMQDIINNIPDRIKKDGYLKKNIMNIIEYIIYNIKFIKDYYNIKKNSNGYKTIFYIPSKTNISLIKFKELLQDIMCDILKYFIIKYNQMKKNK
jgi:hypothetical protein